MNNQFNPCSYRGFTILEMAIVLVVIGLILAAGSSTLPWVNQERMLEKTRAVMTQASTAVLAFTLTNNRLPCPADPTLNFGDANFGKEDCNGNRQIGVVPHEAILLSAPVMDATHRPVIYAVYRNPGINADLAAVNNLFDGLDEPVPVLNVHDFCAALKNSDSAAGINFASISTSITIGGCDSMVLPVTFINQAFILSSAGLEDADGDTELFDGYNIDGIPACFASPQQGRSAAYDDLVSAVSFDAVLGKVCS